MHFKLLQDQQRFLSSILDTRRKLKDSKHAEQLGFTEGIGSFERFITDNEVLFLFCM